MAIHDNQEGQQREAILELLITIKYCLDFEKKGSDKFWNEEGCLGYSAFILLCTVIDTIGSFYRGTDVEIPFGSEKRKIEENKAWQHFYILNHPDYFDLNLKENTIKDFYGAYRSRVVHNSSLPQGNFLINDKKSLDCFYLNEKGDVLKVNLWGLSQITDMAASRFLYFLENGTFHEGYKLAAAMWKELRARKKEDVPPWGRGITEASGFGLTDEEQELYKRWRKESNSFSGVFPPEENYNTDNKDMEIQRKIGEEGNNGEFSKEEKN